MDPITGHSTLNASQLGLPSSSAELIDAAVDETTLAIPQPVGAFSSSVAVKPTSGNSTDLNEIIGAPLLDPPWSTPVAQHTDVLHIKGILRQAP